MSRGAPRKIDKESGPSLIHSGFDSDDICGCVPRQVQLKRIDMILPFPIHRIRILFRLHVFNFPRILGRNSPESFGPIWSLPKAGQKRKPGQKLFLNSVKHGLTSYILVVQNRSNLAPPKTAQVDNGTSKFIFKTIQHLLTHLRDLAPGLHMECICHSTADWKK